MPHRGNGRVRGRRTRRWGRVERCEPGRLERSQHRQPDGTTQRLEELYQSPRFADVDRLHLVLSGQEEDREGQADPEAERDQRQDDPADGDEAEGELPQRGRWWRARSGRPCR